MIEKHWVYKGFPCVVKVIEHLGHRCGYVGLTKDHPLYGQKRYDFDLECNGGITYSESSLSEVEDTEHWWLGFDYAHFWDRPDPAYADPDWMSYFVLDYCTTTTYLPEAIKDVEYLVDQLIEYSE